MRFLLGVFLCAATAPPAWSQVAEVRAGIGAHDLGVIGDFTVKEESGVINAEIIFEEPEVLKWAFSPQPYIGGQLNLGGGTSYGGAGLLWRQNFGKKFVGTSALASLFMTAHWKPIYQPLISTNLILLRNYERILKHKRF